MVKDNNNNIRQRTTPMTTITTISSSALLDDTTSPYGYLAQLLDLVAHKIIPSLDLYTPFGVFLLLTLHSLGMTLCLWLSVLRYS